MRSGPNSELGDFLRSRRERLDPTAFDLGTRRRRTPGLRREEVAALAGIGVDWYIRLEQGRCVRPSTSTVDALARALRLSSVEQAHLRKLAGATGREPFVREAVPPSLRNLVDQLPQPAYITGCRLDILAWNPPSEEFFRFSRLEEKDRNILIHVLTTPQSRRSFGAAWASQAQRLLAQFRATYDEWAGDPAFTSLVQRLRHDCPEFTAWWKGHDVRQPATGIKLLRHPKKGLVRLSHTSFQSNDDPRLRLVVYSSIE